MPRDRIRGVALGILLLLLPAPAGAASTASDAYLTGYVAAVLEREFQLLEPRFEVHDGVVTIYPDGLTAVQRDRIATALSGLRGVDEVRMAEAPPEAAPAPPGSTGAGPAEAPAEAPVEPSDRLVFLPQKELFQPLMADPRWPHFSASYQRFLGDEEIGNASAVSFGETFGLLGGPAPLAGEWQLGVQAAVFALFDLDEDSKDLVNADYWVGLPLSYRYGRFSAVARLFHQSSHLGDEFLLRNRVDRINLSYESADLKLSYDIGYGLRAYGGGGVLFHDEPDLAPWSTQVGLEYYAPFTLWGGLARPVAAIDVQNREESDWDTDLSVRAGLQFENPGGWTQRLQLLVEYFNGRNVNGQFYERSLEYIGLGAHVYF